MLGREKEGGEEEVILNARGECSFAPYLTLSGWRLTTDIQSNDRAVGHSTYRYPTVFDVICMPCVLPQATQPSPPPKSNHKDIIPQKHPKTTIKQHPPSSPIAHCPKPYNNNPPQKTPPPTPSAPSPPSSPPPPSPRASQ